VIHPAIDVASLCNDGDKRALVFSGELAHFRVDLNDQFGECGSAEIRRKNELADSVTENALPFELPVSILPIDGQHGPAMLSGQVQNIRIFRTGLEEFRIDSEFDFVC